MTTQRPTEPNTWLYQDTADGERLWANEVRLTTGAPPWQKATDEEYQQWQVDHPAEPVDGTD